MWASLQRSRSCNQRHVHHERCYFLHPGLEGAKYRHLLLSLCFCLLLPCTWIIPLQVAPLLLSYVKAEQVVTGGTPTSSSLEDNHGGEIPLLPIIRRRVYPALWSAATIDMWTLINPSQPRHTRPFNITCLSWHCHSVANDAIFGDHDKPPRTIGFLDIVSAGFNICNTGLAWLRLFSWASFRAALRPSSMAWLLSSSSPAQALCL